MIGDFTVTITPRPADLPQSEPFDNMKKMVTAPAREDWQEYGQVVEVNEAPLKMVLPITISMLTLRAAGGSAN